MRDPTRTMTDKMMEMMMAKKDKERKKMPKLPDDQLHDEAQLQVEVELELEVQVDNEATVCWHGMETSVQTVAIDPLHQLYHPSLPPMRSKKVSLKKT